MYCKEFTYDGEAIAAIERIKAATVARLQKMAERREITKTACREIEADKDRLLSRFASSVLGLVDAIHAKRSVFLKLEKYPARGLDYGRHWYSLYFVTAEGQTAIFWPGCSELAKVVYMDENNRDRSLRKWMFSSGAIGMDRALDALDGVGYFLRDCGFGYVQLTSSDVV